MSKILKREPEILPCPFCGGKDIPTTNHTTHMADDPANFYARLQSSIDADTRREREALRPSDATPCSGSSPTPEEIDREAVAKLELKHSLAKPNRPGWWRGAPNPFAVPYKENDDEL